MTATAEYPYRYYNRDQVVLRDRRESVSWFVAAGDFCSDTVDNLVDSLVSLLSCCCMPDIHDPSRYRSNTRAGANRENRDSMGLLAAVFTGRESKARELVCLPWTNVNAQYSNGNTPLILAVQGGKESLVRLLLDHPLINVNIRGFDGFTALIRAVQEKTEIAALLISRPDANVNLSTYYGTTALTAAIRGGNEDIVQLLLSRPDIDINVQSRHGENALVEAMSYRKYDIARELILRPEAEVDVMDYRDRTPLIMAVQYGCAELVRLLLFAGADPFTEDDHGRNALYYALRRSAGSAVNTHLHAHSSQQVHLLHHQSGYCTKTLLSQVVVSSTMAANCEMVHDLVEAMSQPQSLGRLCRTVIRRVLRAHHAGHGVRLKPSIDKFRQWEVPKPVKRFLAYQP